MSKLAPACSLSLAALPLQTPGHSSNWVPGHSKTYPAPNSCLGQQLCLGRHSRSPPQPRGFITCIPPLTLPPFARSCRGSRSWCHTPHVAKCTVHLLQQFSDCQVLTSIHRVHPATRVSPETVIDMRYHALLLALVQPPLDIKPP